MSYILLAGGKKGSIYTFIICGEVNALFGDDFRQSERSYVEQEGSQMIVQASWHLCRFNLEE